MLLKNSENGPVQKVIDNEERKNELMQSVGKI